MDIPRAEVSEVVASYHRARGSGELFDTFYDLFLAKSPEIPPKFARTDFRHQKLALKESLLMMLSLNTGSQEAHREIERLGEVHSRRHWDIRPALYELWLDALCESLARHDPAWRPDLDSQWRQAMRPGITLMTSLY